MLGALDALRASALFAVVPERELRAVAPELRPCVFAPGEEIVREGDPGETCYLIAEGDAAVVARDLIGAEVTLVVFHPGDTFGEMALASDRPRTATVRAQGAVRAYALDREAFRRLRVDCPAFADRVDRHVRLLDVDAFLKKASPFARLPADALRRVADALEPLRVRAGDTIVREGEAGDRFYLVRSGRFEVTQRGRRLQTLGAGDCIGEVALLTGGPRIATVRALEDGELLSLAKPEFDALMREHSALVARFRELTRIRYGAAPGQSLALPDPVTTLMPFLKRERRDRYWLLLAGSVGIFGALTLLVSRTDTSILTQALLVVGAFIGPVLYLVYLADSQLLPERPWRLALTFLLGAAFGLPLAALIEQRTLAGVGALGPALVVGVVEEIAKVAGLLWVLGRAVARFQMDGVVYGAAAGMGFAAFETLAYGLQRSEAVGALVALLWLRALLSPFGHGTWTAIVGAALWRGRVGGLPRLDGGVLAAFAVSVGLHTLWDWQPLRGAAGIVWLLVVGVVGILVLRTLVHRATREEIGAALALNPELAAGEAALPRVECHVCGQRSLPGARYCIRCGSALRA